MDILIIEDDEIKLNQIVEHLCEIFHEPTISIAKSIQGGNKKLREKSYNFILIDMTLPTFDYKADDDGGRIRAYGGREILRQMDRRKISAPVIVVTQFDRFGKGANSLGLDELNMELQKDHNENYRGCVYYNAAYENWKNDLQHKIMQLGLDEE